MYIVGSDIFGPTTKQKQTDDVLKLIRYGCNKLKTDTDDGLQIYVVSTCRPCSLDDNHLQIARDNHKYHFNNTEIPSLQ